MRGAGQVPCGEEKGGGGGWTTRRQLSDRPLPMPAPCVARTLVSTLKHTLCAQPICASGGENALAE
jgi:hypothetical protein